MKQRQRPPAARPNAIQLGRVGVGPLAVSALLAVAALGAVWMWLRIDTQGAAEPHVAAAPPAAVGTPQTAVDAPLDGAAPTPEPRRETNAPSAPADRLLRVHGALVSWAEANGGNYPQTLAALAAADGAGRRYLNEADLVDGFGRPWIYVAPSNRAPYQLHSFGRDGQPGGEGEDQDLFLADVLPR
ncbi:MAG: hypothetical protein GC161_04605 [Planctomycetaceae bacterium]|nr:hypothetical protein [Planctomycetaceae bacterium]